MVAATMTSKGQITVPAAVREEMGAKEGTQIEFVKVAEGRWEMRSAQPVSRLRGMFGPAKRTVTIDEMNAAIAQMGAEADDRT